MFRDVLVPTDGSACADAAVSRAADVAGQYDATLHGLFVMDTRMSPLTPEMDPEEVADVEEDVRERTVGVVEDAAADAGCGCRTDVVVGTPHEEIADYVGDHGIDLVVMGTHGRRGLDRALLGSTTERLLRTLDVPVMAVPTDR